jgi:hypothetical protein
VAEPKAGSELRFLPNYSALMRSMSSPFVVREYLGSDDPQPADGADSALVVG